MSPAGILQTEMDEDAVIELEIQQELEGINLDADELDLDERLDGNNNEEDNSGADDTSLNENAVEGEMVPAELEEYIRRIQKQRLDFEQELQECDSVLQRDPMSLVTEADNKLVVHSDWKELADAAAEEGLTVDEYRQKLLHDIENDPFELEELEVGDEEFDRNLKALLESNALDAVLPPLSKGDPDFESTDEDVRSVPKELTTVAEEEETGLVAVQENEESVDKMEDDEGAKVKDNGAADAGAGNTELTSVDNEGATCDTDDAGGFKSGSAEVKGSDEVEGAATTAEGNNDSEASNSGTVAVRQMNPLQEFERFLRQQMELAEEKYAKREHQLRQELEKKRAVEEHLMLTMEEQRLEAMRALEKEEKELALQKEERQKKLDEEIDQRQTELKVELRQHEETIATLTEQLEEDRHYLEKTRRAEAERKEQQDQEAAMKIQRCYRGYRVRTQYKAERETLAHRKEQRKMEKEQQRIEEIEKQIQERKDEEKRQEEMERQRREEEERRQKEEEECKQEAERKAREEEERKRKEEEDRKKKELEEKQRLQEEKKRKEAEAKRLREEEERKRKEEEERQKREEEERKRKEEEERIKREEEERIKREEEERLKREEEERKKRAEEEARKKQEEEERKRKEEEERIKLEEERKRKEDEEKRKRLEEEEKRKKEEGKTPRLRETAEEDKQSQKNEEREKAGNKSQESHVKNSDAEIPEEEVQDSGKVNLNILPDHLEARRLAWMKSCIPWSKVSNEPWKLKSASSGKAPRRPLSAKKLSPLPNETILASAQVASLRQVTTVELCDLPGHSLSTLGQCIHLKHLKLRQCGLVSVEDLSQCKHLQCIDVQDNLVEYVDLKELNNLHVLNLSHNKLTSIHGLTSCNNIRWLDVSHNRLTKLGGLSPLRRLHTLLASNNQMVSTAGLEQCPTIQRLDVSSNYLTDVEGLDRLGLLLTLDVASNNLSQIPSLGNQILLQELILRENSIGPSIDLSVAWLPLLTNLDLSQNIIEEVEGSGSGLLNLKRLDLAVNQIVDLPSFLPSISACPRLEDLSLLGNPVLDEDNFRNNVKNAVLSLRCLNGETVRTLADLAPSSTHSTSFEVMCLTQVQLHKDIKVTFEKECRSWDTHPQDGSSHVCADYFKFCDKSFKMAVEHRYAHEYSELSSTNIPAAPNTPRSSRPSSARSPKLSTQGKPSVQDHFVLPRKESSDFGKTDSGLSTEPAEKTGSAQVRQSVIGPASSQKEPVAPVLSEKEKFELALRGELPQAHAASVEDSSQSTTVLSSVQRGSVQGAMSGLQNSGFHSNTSEGAFRAVSEDFDASERRRNLHINHTPVTTPQLSAKEKFEMALAGFGSDTASSQPATTAGDQTEPPAGRKPSQPSPEGVSHITADVVGGFLKSEGLGSTSDETDISADRLNKFLDNGNLDDLEEMMEGLQFDIDGFLDLDQFDFDEDFLEKGWRPEDTPQMPQRIPSSSASAKPPLPPVPSLHLGATHAPAPPPGRPAQAWRNSDSPLSDIRTKVPARPPSSVASREDSQAITTGRSKREERIAEEWGFRDSRTAELMMQRAKKMRYNAERRKKLSKLDPHQRLKLFRKIEEVTKIHAVRPPPARVLPRKEYFQAREEEAQQKEMEKQMEMRTKAGRTYEWIHTQVGDYDVSSSRINNMRPVPKKTTSDGQLSHQQYLFHSPSPVSEDLDSTSHSGFYQAASHRHSLSGGELSLTGQSTLLPPIQTGSAPSVHSREREKISWRTEEVEKSVGWGGGKKRSHRK